MLNTLLWLHSPQTRGSCQPLFQTSKSNSSILAEKYLDKNLRCRQRNHPFDTTRFDVVPTDTIPTYHASSHDAPAWFSTRWDGRQSLARSACSWRGSWDCLHHHHHRWFKCFLLNLLAFRSIAKIFSWRCDSHFQGEMRRGDGATALSGATIATYLEFL